MLFVEIIETEDNFLFFRREIVLILEAIEEDRPEAVHDLLVIFLEGDMEDVFMLSLADTLMLVSLISLEDHPWLVEQVMKRTDI